MRNRRGFTLIEMLISITLLMLLFGAAVPFFRTQTRAVDIQAGQWDALFTAQYAVNALDRELRVAGTGVLLKQPLMVQADSLALTFNGDLVTRTKTDPSAVYYDPDALANTVLALQPTAKITLPRASMLYPDSPYVHASGIPGSAETISYWLTKDSTTTTRTDDWLLLRRANNGVTQVIARSLLVPVGDRPFRYFTVDSLEKTFEVAKTRLPLIHNAAIHGSPTDTGKSLQADSIRIVTIRLTAVYRGPDGKDIIRTVENTIRIVNAGLVGRATCGQAPYFGSALGAVATNTGQPQVTLTWSPALDEPGGEQDVERYVLYRRRPEEATFTEPFAGVVAGEVSYSFVDTDVFPGERWVYGAAAQDCTPTMSGAVSSPMVTIPDPPIVIEPPIIIPPILSLKRNARMRRAKTSRRRPRARNRRGSALILTVLLTSAFAALALSAIYLRGSAELQGKYYHRERDYRYVAEAAIAIGKSKLATDPKAIPDTGYVAFMKDQALVAADGTPIPGAKVNLYAGPTGSTTGQFGTYASVIAEAHDDQGSKFVRRLELTQETFAKFAYYSNREKDAGGGTIYFGNNDNLWGPVWSNDVISIASSRATFNDAVGTAKTISGTSNGTFKKGYSQNQKPIPLPTNDRLANLPGFAAAGDLSFAAPTSGNETTPLMRFQFVSVDLNGDGDAVDEDEGFVRVYIANVGNVAWLRGDYPSTATASTMWHCGDYHMSNGVNKFFPAAVHNTAWFRAKMQVSGGGTMTSSSATTESGLSLDKIMDHSGSRCFLGGDPNLVASERNTLAFTAAQKEIGGTDTTFTPVGRFGAWQPWPGVIDPRLVNRKDRAYLFPLHRTLNAGFRGVVHSTGTVVVSGVLRSNVTIYSQATVVIGDDFRYANDPAGGTCEDMAGIIAANDIIVADNALNTPIEADGDYKNVDDTKDLYIHGIMMALNTSFRVQNHSSGPSNVNDCGTADSGRGCLFLTGGLIQEMRGAVGLLSGQGFVKRYSYDRCALLQPPPYFPSTGRYEDNRYYEVDPVRFKVDQIFKSLAPNP